MWKSDPVYRENTPGLTARVLIIHFKDEIFKNSLAILPEMQGINQLLFDSQFGMKFLGAAQAHIEIQMKAIIRTSGIEKLLRLIDILDYMSKTKDKQLLASKGYSKIRKSVDFDRFDKAYRFMIEDFQENITLEKISDIVGMTPTSFCRYFKKHTNKSFLTVLNEIRVGHSCKLLIESNLNIS